MPVGYLNPYPWQKLNDYLLDYDKDRAIELISSANVMLDLLLDKGYDYDDVEQYVLKRLKET